MKKIIFLLSIAILFCSCAFMNFGKKQSESVPPAASVVTGGQTTAPSMQEQSASKYWITRPSDSSLTVLGVSPRMVKHDDEIAAAKEDAARKIALFYGVSGKIESTHSAGAYFFDYVNDSQITLLCDNDYTGYIEQLTYDPQNDLIIDDGSVLIRFQYAASAGSLNYRTVMSENGRPNWIYYRDVPQFDNYITAIGFARNQRLLKDTIYRATEAAAAKILEELYMSIQIRDTMVATQSSSTGISFIYAVSEGRLNNFFVLEYWIDPETGYGYSLAVARK